MRGLKKMMEYDGIGGIGGMKISPSFIYLFLLEKVCCKNLTRLLEFS